MVGQLRGAGTAGAGIHQRFIISSCFHCMKAVFYKDGFSDVQARIAIVRDNRF
jgi:hypothetical protein